MTLLFEYKSHKGNVTNPLSYRYEYSSSLPGQRRSTKVNQGGFYTPNDTNEDDTVDVSCYTILYCQYFKDL